MKTMFTVHDSKVGAWGVPFCCLSRGEALRQFADVADDAQSAICRHPQDFALYEIGEFDERSGQVTLKEKVSLGVAIEFKTKPAERLPLEDAASGDVQDMLAARKGK